MHPASDTTCQRPGSASAVAAPAREPACLRMGFDFYGVGSTGDEVMVSGFLEAVGSLGLRDRLLITGTTSRTRETVLPGWTPCVAVSITIYHIATGSSSEVYVNPQKTAEISGFGRTPRG